MSFGRLGASGGFGGMGGSSSANNRDFPYPTFPFTTLAKLQTVSDMQAHSAGTYVDQAMADSPYGATAIQWTANGSNGGVISKTLLSTPVDVRNGNIRFTFKPLNQISNSPGLFQFNIVIMSAGTPAAPSGNNHQAVILLPIEQLSTSATVGRWQSIGIPVNSNFTAVGTGADLSAIKYATISLGGGANSMALGNVDFVPNPRSKAAVLVRFDDGYDQSYTIGFPLLQAVGAPAALAIGASQTHINGGGQLTTSQIRTLLNAGWQYMSQSWSTEDQPTVDGWTSAQRLAEYVSTRNVAKQWNRYRDSYDGTYYSNVNYQDMVAWPELNASFRTLTNFLSGVASGGPLYLGEGFPFGDPKNIISLGLASDGGSGVTLTTFLNTALEQARTNRGVLVLTIHNELGDPNALQAFNDMITYVTVTHPSEIEFSTMRKLLAPYNGDALQG